VSTTLSATPPDLPRRVDPFTPKAVLDPSLNTSVRVINEVTGDTYSVIQQFADAEMAVAGGDEAGTFRFLQPQHSPRGRVGADRHLGRVARLRRRYPDGGGIGEEPLHRRLVRLGPGRHRHRRSTRPPHRSGAGQADGRAHPDSRRPAALYWQRLLRAVDGAPTARRRPVSGSGVDHQGRRARVPRLQQAVRTLRQPAAEQARDHPRTNKTVDRRVARVAGQLPRRHRPARRCCGSGATPGRRPPAPWTCSTRSPRTAARRSRGSGTSRTRSPATRGFRTPQVAFSLATDVVIDLALRART
jgi:hypothetical protein